jgi:hypothetical protein
MVRIEPRTSLMQGEQSTLTTALFSRSCFRPQSLPLI